MTLRRWLSWPGTIRARSGHVLSPPWSCSRRRRRRLTALEHADGTTRPRRPRGARAGRGRATRSPAWRRRSTAWPQELAARERGAAHVGPAAAADARRRVARAQDAADVDRGYIETLQMPEIAGDPERRARYFDTIAQETRRLERIVRDLLDLARYENGVGALEPRVFVDRAAVPAGRGAARARRRCSRGHDRHRRAPERRPGVGRPAPDRSGHRQPRRQRAAPHAARRPHRRCGARRAGDDDAAGRRRYGRRHRAGTPRARVRSVLQGGSGAARRAPRAAGSACRSSKRSSSGTAERCASTARPGGTEFTDRPAAAEARRAAAADQPIVRELVADAPGGQDQLGIVRVRSIFLRTRLTIVSTVRSVTYVSSLHDLLQQRRAREHHARPVTRADTGHRIPASSTRPAGRAP